MDKFWESIRKSPAAPKTVEILNITFTNSAFSKVSEIKELFDSWSEADFHSLIIEARNHPTFESSPPEYSFGEREMPYPSDFFESCSVRDAPYEIWKMTNRTKRKNFF